MSDPSFVLGSRKVASDCTFLLWKYPEICVAVSSNMAVVPYRLQKVRVIVRCKLVRNAISNADLRTTTAA